MIHYREEISKEELTQLETISFSGTTYVIEKTEDALKVCEQLKTATLLGFDTETRPAFKKGVHHKVALLQLSDGKNCYLFRLNKMGLPDCLAEILANKNIIKTGVAIKDDIKGLNEWHKFTPAGFIELQEFTTRLGIKSNSLKKLSGIVLGYSLSKRQRTSNWENEQLTEAQIKYAATDAWIGYEIYQKLQEEI